MVRGLAAKGLVVAAQLAGEWLQDRGLEGAGGDWAPDEVLDGGGKSLTVSKHYLSHISPVRRSM